MAINRLTDINKYNASYSPIPLRAEEDNLSEFTKFTYLNYFRYENYGCGAASLLNYNGETLWNVIINYNYDTDEATTQHPFKPGDKVLVTRNGILTTSYLVNVIFTIKYVDNTRLYFSPQDDLSNFFAGQNRISKFVENRLPLDPDGQMKVDLSNVTKDFVKTNFVDTDFVRDASETRTTYFSTIGTLTNPVIPFVDNYFISGGFVGFIIDGIAEDYPLFIGDTIDVLQDDYEWNYSSYSTIESPVLGSGYNFYSFSGATDAYFDIDYNDINFGTLSANIIPNNPNDPILSDPNWTNGPTFIGKVVSGDTVPYNRIASNRLTTTPITTPVTSGGTIFAQFNLDYNGTHTITNIESLGGTQFGVWTDSPWGGNSPTIGGVIKVSTTRDLYTSNSSESDRLFGYVGTQPQYGYDKTYFNNYVINSMTGTTYEDYNFSSIYKTNKEYRVEKNGKQWLLAHLNPEEVFDKDNTFLIVGIYTGDTQTSVTLEAIDFSTLSEDTSDLYVPISLEYIKDNPNRITLLGPGLENIYDDVYRYDLALFGPGLTQLNNELMFKVNNDCSRFEVLHLIWEDRLGSFISYPFIYANTRSTEVERQEYYKELGNWNNDNTYSVNSYDRGNATYFTRGRDKVVLNSGWVTDEENELIKDMFKSNKVFFQDSDGTVYGAIINTNNITLETDDIEGVHNYTIPIKLVQDDIRL